MRKKQDVPSGLDETGEFVYRAVHSDQMLECFKAMIASMMKDAQGVWADLWGEMKDCGSTTGIVPPDADKGFKPPHGWPEFLEKLWLLRHYIDHTSRICEGDG